MKALIYPFTFEEWKKHPSNKQKLKWCKTTGAQMDLERKRQQLELIF